MSLKESMLPDEAEDNLSKLGSLIQKLEALFIDCVNESPQPVEEHMMVQLLLYWKIVEKIDAVFVNVENGCENPAKSILRDALENLMYLQFMLQVDNEKRALSYYVGHMKQQIEYLNLLNSNTTKGREVKAYLNNVSNQKYSDREVSRQIREIRERLRRTKLRPISDEWDNEVRRRRQENKPPYIKWHNLYNGPENLKEIATVVGMTVEYNVLYNIFSGEVHSGNIMNQFKIDKQGKGYIKQLRTNEQSDKLLSMAVSFGRKATRILLEAHFPSRLHDFNIWCLDNIMD